MPAPTTDDGAFTGFLTEEERSQIIAALLPSYTRMPEPPEIYDCFMAQIEPELTTSMLPHLKDLYANETPGQSKARQARYDAAYKEYDACFAAYSSSLTAQAKTYERIARKSTESVSREEEEGVLESIEKHMTDPQSDA